MENLTKSREELISELLDQKQEIDSLKIRFNKEVIERNQIESVLNERLKELKCHDQLSDVLSNSELSVDEVCEKIVQIIPPAWQFPEIAKASIQIPNHVFSSPGFKPGKYSMIQDIKINQAILGQIEVCYPVDQIPATDPIFLPEESSLLFSIAVKLGNYLERKEKEQALKVSEEKHKDLIENINDVIYTTDKESNITFISPSITRLLGYRPEDVIGKNFSNFTGATSEHLKERFELIKYTSELESEYQILSVTGEPHWIRFSSKPIIKKGKFVGVTGILTDITEKKQVELELQKSESLYRSILQASPDTILIADLEGRVIFTSPMALKMFGYEYSGFPLNSLLFEFLDPKDHAKAKDAIGQMFEGIYTGATNYAGIKADGSKIDIEVNGEFIRDSEGMPTSMVFVVRDISDRKLAEEKLQKSEETYRNLVESINDVLYDITIDGTIKYVSPASERIFNIKAESLIGQNFFRFVHPEDQPFLLDIFRNNRFSDFKEIEYRCLTETGETVWVQASARNVYEEDRLVGRTGILHDITERKLTEEKLRKSEEQYRELVESVNDVIFEIDASGIIRFVSPSVLHVLGYTVEEAIGRNIFSFLYPEDLPMLVNAFKNLSARDYSFMEYRYVRKDGSVRWVRSSTTPQIKDGEMSGATGTLTDVTERRVAEEKLRKNEEQYRNLVTSLNDAIYEINQEGIVQFVSPVIEKIIGYAPEELIGKSTFSFMHPDDIPIVMKALSQLDHINIPHLEYRYLTKSGHICWVRTSTSPIFENGLLTGGRGTLTDITDYKHKEDKLRKLSQAVEQSPISIVITDLDGNIEYANPKACETTGYTIEELKGNNPRVLKSGETSKDEYQYLWESISHGNTWRGTFHNKRKNGELYWESSQITPITDENGNIKSYLAIKEDITERKKIQEELVKSEELFSQIADQSKTVIWEVDPMGLYTYVSPLAEIIWGYPIDEITGKKYFFDLHPAAGREEFKKAVLESIHRKEHFSDLQNQIITKDNRTIWVSTNGIPVLDHHNNLIGYWGADNDITERTLAEEALKINEAALNQAQEISKMCSWELDLLTDKLTWSKNYYQLMGIPTGSEMNTQFFLERVHREDIHLVDEKLEEMKLSKKAVTYDIRLWMPNKEYRWIQNNIVPEFKDGKLIRFKGVNIDVTEKKLAEENIRKQNERLSAIINAVPDLIFISDREGTYLEYFNASSHDLLYSTDQLIGSTVRDVFEEETANLHIRKINECLEQNNLVTFEYSSAKNGADRYFEARLAPLGDDKVLRFVRDFTQEKLMNNEIKKLSQAVEQSPDIIVITDLKGNIEYVNPAFYTITGYQPEEVLGQNPRILKSGETSQSVYKDLWATIKAGDNWYGEWQDKKKNGELYWEYVSITPIRNESGKVTNYLAIKQDITQRKLSENEIRELNTNLEVKVQERTKDLAKANISLLSEIEVRKLAEKALTSSEEKYRSVVENVNEVIFQTDPEGLWIFLNRSWEKVTGFTVEESLGKLFVDYVHPDDRVRNWELFEPLINRKKDYCRHEIRYLTKDGGFRWVEVFARLGLNDNNEITGTFGTLMDITERKLAEDSSQQLSARLTLALRAGRFGVWDYDVVNNILLWDNQMFAIYGIREEDFSGAYEAWQKGLHPDDRIQGNEDIQLALKGEKEFNTEFRVVWPDGSIHFVRALAAVERDHDGRALRMIGTNWDITLQKQAANFENEMLQLSTKLTGVTIAEIDSALNLALLRIGQFLNADRAYIFEINDSVGFMNNTYEWCNEGIHPEIENLQDIPCDMLPNWIEILRTHNNIVIPSVQDLPENWQGERDILEPQGIQSLLVIPLIVDKILIGFVGLDSVKTKRDYNSTEINMLKVWSSMQASLIQNKRTESLLEQTRQNYETFFNTIDDFLWVLDEQGNIIHTNNTVIKRLEYTTEELLNQSVLMVHPAERREEAGRIVGQMLAGTSEFCPVPIVRKSGKQIPVETRVKAGFWNGVPVIFGVSKDISQIQLSEQKFSTAFHSSSSIMTITRFDNNQFVEVNNAFVNTLGYSREEIVGQTLITLGIIRDIPDEGTMQELISKGFPLKGIEVIVFSKSNEQLIFLMSVEDIYIGSERCILSVAVNISERKKMEDDLRKARMEAEQANLAKSEFLSRMSHELRTPMNSILGFGQLLEMGELTTSQKKGVTHILKSGKHLLNLINEVLDISRIEAGKISLSLEPVQISAVIHEMIDIVKLQANERQIKIELVSSSANQLFVKSDRQRLKQVLLNLLNNAIKYNRESGSVRIKAEVQPANGAGIVMIKISITDTGWGISSDDLTKLFIPFERIGAEKSLTEGTGLGLTVVKRIIDAMGGIINVESVFGEGSCFWFELPLIESQLGSLRKSGGLPVLESNPANKTGTILYIEDNVSNTELVEQILSSQRTGIRLITRIYGKQAIGTTIEYMPKLILLDLDLPDIHGSEVLKQLKAHPKTKEIPVIIVSANAMPKQIDKFMREGAENYLTKPLDIIEFLKIIDEFIV